MRSVIGTMLAVTGLTAGCAEGPAGEAEAAQARKERVRMEEPANGGKGVSGLPSSFGRSFATLDDYLAHLRDHAGPIDLPWYREVRPGVYEYVTGMRPAPPPKTYTREELMKAFGFSR